MAEVFTGIFNHEDQRGRLRDVSDAGGEAILSWRAAVLPYVPRRFSWISKSHGTQWPTAKLDDTIAILTAIVGHDTFMGEARCEGWVGRSLGKSRQPILLIEHNLLGTDGWPNPMQWNERDESRIRPCDERTSWGCSLMRSQSDS